MTSLSTPQLSGILLSAVSATLTLSACGGVVDDSGLVEDTGSVRNGPLSPNEVPVATPPEVADPTTPELPVAVADECIPRDSRITDAAMSAGLDPRVPVDYVGIFDFNYQGEVDGEETYVMVASESSGTPCLGANDRPRCREDFAALTSPNRDQNEELWFRFVVTDKDGARELTSVDDIENFVGTINTFNEAALVLSLRGAWTDCSKLSKEGDNYVTEITRSGGCGVEDYLNELTLSPDGESEEVLLETIPSNCVEGRLTEGVCLDPEDPHAAEELGVYLSGVCQLETAAVAAFMRLADELKRHNAPETLIQGANQAALEEIGHAKATHRLALRAGVTPRPVGYRPRKNRGLLDIAIENAREGCVRELFGAACAHLQGQTARDPEIRKTWQRIAEEETRHAELSLAIDNWLQDQLSEGEQAQVEQARQEAVMGLRASTRKEPASVLVEQAGVPTSAQVGQLLTELAPLFA